MISAQKKFLFVLFVLLLCFPGVMAQTVSFADPDSTTHKDVYMYNSTGVLLGTYNTTSPGISLPENNESVFFVFKPQYSNPLDDPTTFLSGIIGFVQTNVLSLLILAAMAGLLFKRF